MTMPMRDRRLTESGRSRPATTAARSISSYGLHRRAGRGRRFGILDCRFWISDWTSDKLIHNPDSKIPNPYRSRTVDSEITYFVTYPCPRCKAELEAEHGGWQ